MKAPANCRLIGRWRIVKADIWDRAHLDLCGPAMLTITAEGGEIAFGALEAGLEVEYARDFDRLPLDRMRGRRPSRGRRDRRTARRRHDRDRVRLPQRRRSRPQGETGYFFNSLLGGKHRAQLQIYRPVGNTNPHKKRKWFRKREEGRAPFTAWR